ncbi:VanZ family protein [Uliginosibacterium aquaticum]|uniref:VanZ family protein n=1 Tax=Uliginosibacterium aquaticum TaxID=2731212 RepID=A0ABX2II40_9RHOO|nr:VanZ family protein [Uliginosibacterium aquaticum]NSL54026.1 VanZ family protein [Uliginosibacterium aquaticum]
MPYKLLRLLAALAALAIVLGLFIGGAQPYAVGLFTPPWDKVAHATVFAGFAFILHAGIGWRWGWAVLAALALGSADELQQMFLPGRQAGFDDLTADLIGAALGVLLASILKQQVRARRQARV